MGTFVISVVVASVLLWPMAGAAEEIDWQTAAARLAAERTRAETCASILKRHGAPGQVSSGELVYGEARAEVDAVIGALIVALVEQKPLVDPLAVEQQMSRGVAARDAFCQQAVALAPPSGGERGDPGRAGSRKASWRCTALDAAVLPCHPPQHGPPPTPCPCLRPRQLPALAGAARCGRAVVADDLARKARDDRWQSDG